MHYGIRYENAFWDGAQMVYGDGGGQLFNEGAFTHALDVIGHELTHGVTQYTAGLEYSKQSGALNESFSDVFGVLVKQFAAKQEADEDEEKWLIGAGSLVPKWGRALRSMKAPGTAWQGDQQPATMDDYVDLPDDNDPSNDNGGVHINSGIPNHAFYLAATTLGGYAWEKAGRVWYVTLTDRLGPDSQFTDAATATVEVARELFGDEVERAVDGRVDRGGGAVVNVSIIRGGGMAGIATRTQLASDALPKDACRAAARARVRGRAGRRRRGPRTPTRRSTR